MDFIDKYGLTKEKAPTRVDGKEVDYDKIKLTIKEGKLHLNKYACTTCGFKDVSLVEAYTNPVESIIAISLCDGGEEGFLLKVTKAGAGHINIRHLLLKLGFMTSANVRPDIVECGDGYLVVGIVDLGKKDDAPQRTAPFGNVGDMMGVHKDIGEKLAGSDF
jgi:hypothetical protein